MSEPKKLPSKNISFRIGDNTYDVKYPNTGQMLQIESLKFALTQNGYNSLVGGDTTASQIARFTTDMIAFFTTCCPKLKKDLNVDTFSELEATSSKKLLQVYIKSIIPWLTEWEIILNTDDDASTEEVKA